MSVDTATMDPQRTAFDQSSRDSFESTKCLLAAFDRLGVPETMLDVGCGPGHLVGIADLFNISATGVDLNAFSSELDVPNLYSRDLTAKPNAWDREFIYRPAGLVLCLEVAEHLPPESADTLCDTLASAVAPGGWLLFSAATPGQGGSGHLNEQPHAYWVEKLAARGLVVDEWHTDELRDDWARCAARAPWYGANLVCFSQGQS